VGVGVDVVEVDMIRHIVEGVAGEAFVSKTFTTGEVAYAAENVEKLAALFAAKEAAFKALRTGWLAGPLVEIRHEPNGAPVVVVQGDAASAAGDQEVTEMLVSLSSTEHWAAAVVVACH
jgi:holo-[acyl-carrier protein] synthase